MGCADPSLTDLVRQTDLPQRPGMKTVHVVEPQGRSEFSSGVRAGIPVWIAVVPVGLLFGAVAVQNGLTVGDAVLASAIIYAGASQLVAVELYGQSVPVWAIVLSVFAVNFRHVLYSAAISPVVRRWSTVTRWIGLHFLIDPQFALAEVERERGRRIGPAWYFGLGIPIYALWIALAWLGATFGRLIENPVAFGFDMILPVYFLALVMGFRGRRNWLPVVLVSGVAATLVYHLPALGSPWHVSIGGLAGVLAAALMPPRLDASGTAERSP